MVKLGYSGYIYRKKAASPKRKKVTFFQFQGKKGTFFQFQKSLIFFMLILMLMHEMPKIKPVISCEVLKHIKVNYSFEHFTKYWR